MPDRRARVGGRIHAREHHPVGTEVQGASCTRALVGLDAHDGVDARALRRLELADEVGLVAATVLEVDQDPVEAAHRARLRGQGAPQVEERADERRARAQAGADGAILGHPKKR
jgi:hypothetical protein